MNQETKWSDFEMWITGAMLQGRRVTLTIKGVKIFEVHPRPGVIEKGPALEYNETRKRLYLSPTNRRILAGLFGDEMSGCIGKRITLEAVPMRVAGKDTLPVRIGPALAKDVARQVDTLTGEIAAQVGSSEDDDPANLDPIEEMISGGGQA